MFALTNVAYPNNSGYNEVNSGPTNIKVSPTGTTNYVIDATVNLDINKPYSVFAIDSVSKIYAAVVSDDLTAPASGKAHVRFFHFSANAPAVDIVVTGGPLIFSNRKLMTRQQMHLWQVLHQLMQEPITWKQEQPKLLQPFFHYPTLV